MTQFRILGPLEVIDDGTPIDIGSPKERAVLAMLASEAGQVVSTDRLINGLWGEEAPASALGTLRTYVSHVRSALSETSDPTPIETAENGYRLVADATAVDSLLFEQLMEDGDLARDDGSFELASRSFAEALALWRGPALADLPDGQQNQIESRRLEELRIRALEERLEADVQLGRHSAVIAELESLVSSHPLRERFAQLLMIALYRSGRQADALRTFQETRDTLAEELGIEPGQDLQELEEAILLHDPALTLAASTEPAASNLPIALTSFVGRSDETRTLMALLESNRLVTLTGAAGSGKTRLALETASLLAPDLPDGIRWVDLAAVDSETHVAYAIASTVLTTRRPGRVVHAVDSEHLEDELLAFVGSKQILVVLDNCEHVIGEAARLALLLMESTATTRLLATSREPLHIPGEQSMRVAPLSVPPRNAGIEELNASNAGQLFLDRARAVDPGFTAKDPAEIAELCRRLDGLPLAIELAAGRLWAMGVRDLVRGLSNRLDLITGSERGRLSRHQTLRAAIGWSYDLLDGPERDTFRRLSYFSGPFTAEAARAVLGSVEGRGFERLAGLVEKSLVGFDRGATPTRYSMLETVRDFGREELDANGDANEVGRAHAIYYVEQTEAADQEAQRAIQQTWFVELDDGIADARRALRWTQDSDLELFVRLAASLGWYWYSRGQIGEALTWLEAALAVEGIPEQYRLAALTRGSLMAFGHGRIDQISQWSSEALELSRKLNDRSAEGDALVLSGLASVFRGDLEGAASFIGEGIAAADESGNLWAKAWGLMLISHTLRNLEHYDASEQMATEAIGIFSEIDEGRGHAYVQLNMAGLSVVKGRTDSAIDLAQAALTTLEMANDGFGVGLASAWLAGLTADRGRWTEAVQHAIRCQEIAKSFGGRWFPAMGLSVLAWTAAEHGASRLAARLYGAAEATEMLPGIKIAEGRWRRRDLLDDELGHDGFVSATSDGANASQNDIASWVAEVGRLVGVATADGDS